MNYKIPRKMTGKMTVMAAVAAVMMAATPALAEEDGNMAAEKKNRGAVMFERMDADSDGKVSLEEFLAAHKERFKKIDADGDGYLTPDEMKAARDEMREGMKEKRKERRGNYEERSKDKGDSAE